MPPRTVRTTLALPTELLQAIDQIVHAGKARSRNEFVAVAVRHELAVQERAAVDAAFAEMIHDPVYQAEASDITQTFAAADWEAMCLAEGKQ